MTSVRVEMKVHADDVKRTDCNARDNLDLSNTFSRHPPSSMPSATVQGTNP